MKNVSLQLQSVLYHNTAEALNRALEAVANALRINQKNDIIVHECIVKYGDASKTPIFIEKDIEEMNEKYGDVLKVEYVFFDENTGTAKGHNLLGKKCKTDYMMIMNPDVIISPHFFGVILKPFNNKKVGLVEARQTPFEHPKEYNTKTFETAWSTTACVIFPTEIFMDINGFDERSFFMYCDDVDFSWRIRLAGYKLYYQPLAPVFHAKQLASDGSWQPTAAEKYYSAEAAIMIAHKWSNPELVARLVWDFKRSKDEIFNKAASEYLKRRKTGKLVRPIDKEHKIATFVKGGYAPHRFGM